MRPDRKRLAKISKHETNLATYDERVASDKMAAQQRNVAAFIADVKAGKACFTTALELRAEMNRLGIKGLNLLWRAGKSWQLASDKNQYDFYFVDYVVGTPSTGKEAGLPGIIPKADGEFVSKEIVRFALHLANTLKEKITTVEQAAPLVQKCFIALGMEAAGTRQLENEHPPRNIFSELVSEAKSAYALFRELEEKRPMTDWDVVTLDTYLREWKWQIEKYQLAERVRASKVVEA